METDSGDVAVIASLLTSAIRESKYRNSCKIAHHFGARISPQHSVGPALRICCKTSFLDHQHCGRMRYGPASVSATIGGECAR